MSHPSLNVVGDRCWRCLGKTVALFSTVECARKCHEDPDLYTPREDPGRASYKAALKAMQSFNWAGVPPGGFVVPHGGWRLPP